MHLNMSSAKWRLFSFGLNVLKGKIRPAQSYVVIVTPYIKGVANFSPRPHIKQGTIGATPYVTKPHTN